MTSTITIVTAIALYLVTSVLLVTRLLKGTKDTDAGRVGIIALGLGAGHTGERSPPIVAGGRFGADQGGEDDRKAAAGQVARRGDRNRRCPPAPPW